MRTQWLLLVIASSLFSVSYAQTTAAPTAATASKSELDSILGVGLSFVRSILSADPTTVTATYSPTSTLSTSSSNTSSTSTSSTPSSTSSRSTSSSTTLASQTSSSFSSSSIATASSLSTTPSAAAASAKPNDKGDSSNRKLAIILGSVLGSLALLSLIMFFCCLRRHRKKHPHDHIGYNHVEKNASSSRQSLAGKRNSSGTLTANSRSRSLSETRSINKDYRAMPSVPPPHRLSKNDATPYGALPISQRNSRHDPFHDRNVATPGRYYDPNTPPAHRTPPVPSRCPQQQSEYFPPYDAPRRSQESSPHSSFGSAKTLGDANHASASAGPSPPLQAQQKHRSLPRSSLANEFNFGFDGRDGSGGYGQDVSREFRRKSVAPL